MGSTRLRILDVDVENRPLAYLGQDFTTAEITAIASCWVGELKTMQVWLLGREDLPKMLLYFKARYDDADMVTGHYIREHDLPVLNGALIEKGLSVLGPKLTSDTKLDLVSRKYISASQENLAAMLGVKAPKVSLSNTEWREANRLTPEGLKTTEARVRGDVLQHMEMRAVMLERGLLGPPRMWRP